MVPYVRRLLFRIARGRLSSLFIGTAFEYASALMPLDRVYEDRFTVIFYHPKPTWTMHLLAVPKRRIPSFASLQLQNAQIQIIVTSLFQAVQHVLIQKDLLDARVIVNGGAYQDVPQIHFHIARDAGEEVQGPSAPRADFRPPKTLIDTYQDAVAFFHPSPTREVHVMLTTRAETPPLLNWDPHQPIQRQSLLNMLVLAQRVVAMLALDRYTLVANDTQNDLAPRLMFQLVSGSVE